MHLGDKNLVAVRHVDAPDPLFIESDCLAPGRLAGRRGH
jgi:hypothetical protein